MAPFRIPLYVLLIVAAATVVNRRSTGPPRRGSAGRRAAPWTAALTLLVFEGARAFARTPAWADSAAAGAGIAAGALAAWSMGRLRRSHMEQALDLRTLRHRLSDLSRKEGPPSAARADVLDGADRYFDSTMALLQHAMGARTAAFFQWSAAEEHFLLRAHASDSMHMKPHAVLSKDVFPFAQLMRSREPLVTAPSREAPVSLPYYEKGEAVRSLAAAPVEGAGGSRRPGFEGVLIVDHPDVGAFVAGDRARLREWAGHLQETLALWRQVAHAEESARELKVLFEGAQRFSALLDGQGIAKELLSLAHDAAPYDAAAVCSFESGEGPYHVAAFEDGAFKEWRETKTGASWARWIFEHAEEAVSFGDLQSQDSTRERTAMPLFSLREPTRGFASFAGLPLCSAKRRFGAFVAGSFSENSFDARSLRTLTVLASHAALSMEAAAMYRRMEELAVTDGLTGLYNHRRFRAALSDEVRRAERTGAALSLLMLDLDHFKRLNDTYGHPAGDSVLRQTAALLRRTVRDIDVAARYGGEEFAVLLIDTDAADALRTAERVRAAVEAETFSHERTQLDVTVSVGAATHLAGSSGPDAALSADALLRSADRALYAAKEAGRNCTRHADALAAEARSVQP
ncbi:MAG: GGDEF domain-containing protein [Acidobacteriota bacterium]|nr:MAG: GGDEF domain-containing protein [Acidobacteriota bacterium]